MYRIIIENRAVKEIESLPDDIIQRVTDIIKGFRLNPHPHGAKKLIGEDEWQIKVSTYRVLYTIDYKQRLVSIYRVKHRRDAYR